MEEEEFLMKFNSLSSNQARHSDLRRLWRFLPLFRSLSHQIENRHFLLLLKTRQTGTERNSTKFERHDFFLGETKFAFFSVIAIFPLPFETRQLGPSLNSLLDFILLPFLFLSFSPQFEEISFLTFSQIRPFLVTKFTFHILKNTRSFLFSFHFSSPFSAHFSAS